jgi:hypothetical protein
MTIRDGFNKNHFLERAKKRNYLLRALFGITILCSHFGCSIGGGLLSSSTQTSALITPSPSPSPSLTNLIGTWTSSCVQFESSYMIATLSIVSTNSTTTLNSVAYFFDDANCTHPIFFTTSGTATLTGGAPATTPSGATKLDLTYGQAFAETKQTLATETFNHSSECGINSWSDNLAQNISGRDCNLLGEQPTEGETIYSIYQITSSGSSFKLRPGIEGDSSSDGTSELTRHIQLNSTLEFHKQ